MSIPPELLKKLKSSFDRESFPAKAFLVKEGTTAKKLFYIEQGCCRAWFNNEGKEVTFQFLFEGNFVSSFETIMDNAVSWYGIETLEPCVVYSIGISEFRRKMEEVEQVKAFYHSYTGKQLLFYQQAFVAAIKGKPEERYQQLLAQHPHIVKRVPQHYIASYLGITSVSLSRIRNRR